MVNKMADTLFKTLLEKGFKGNITLSLCSTTIYRPDLIDWLEFELKERN